MLREMRSDQKTLRQNISEIMWHMRGGLSREEAWSLSPDEREDMIKQIETRQELTQKSGIPLL